MKKKLSALILALVLIMGACTGCEQVGGSSSEAGSSGVENGSEIIPPAETASLSNPQPDGPFINERNELLAEIRDSQDTVKAADGCKTYYISTAGNDMNSGLSPEDAWKTPDKLNTSTLNAGDVVLFQRGGIFRGHFQTSDGVSYGAYAEGDKPQIYGSRTNEVNEGFEETSMKNVYRSNSAFATKTSDVGLIVFNHGEAWGKKQESIKDLKVNYDFLHSNTDNYIYVYYNGGNPAEVFSDIEFCYCKQLVELKGNNVTVENLCFKYCADHCLAGGECENVTIRNCEFGWIGGGIPSHATSRTRYGNAIQFWGNVTNVTVENCYIYQVFDSAITYQYTGKDVITVKNVQFVGNLVEYATTAFEYFLNGEEGSTADTVVIKDNIARLCGYGFGVQRGRVSDVAQLVDRNDDNPIVNYEYSNNILDRATYTLFNINDKNSAYLPKMSGNRYAQVEGMIVGVWNEMKLKDEASVQSATRDASATVAFVPKSEKL